jgi:uncharacterized oxidoreductase
MSSNIILITGGSTGIGLALATRLMEAGNKVIICGRRADKLEEAQASYPELQTYLCDISKEEERISLFEKVTQDYPELNILINNAGIQQYPRFDTIEPWEQTRKEIETNLDAPIHLSMLFSKHLLLQKDAAILNVTSGLAHVPLAAAPVYSATKAALHSFTLSLRHQLANQPLRVIEVSPPHINTDLGVPGTNTAGLSLDLFADEVMDALKRGEEEITYGFSQQTSQTSRAERDEIFKQLNS